MGRPPWLPETVTRAFCGVCGQKPPCTQHYLDHGVEVVECVIVPADDWRGAVGALEWLASRYAATLAGKPVRDADEALERARLIVNQARGR